MRRLLLAAVVLCFMLPFMLNTAAGQNSLTRDIGYEVGLTYTGDVFSNVSGGEDQGLRYLDNFDMTLNLFSRNGPGEESYRFFLYGLGNQGGNLTELVGDVQTVNNIEAQNSWRLYEAWAQYISPDARFSVLGGLYDLNSEFDVLNTAGLFINSSHGIGGEFASTGLTGPSIFPLTSLAIRLKMMPSQNYSLKLGVFDGVPSDPGNTRGTKIYLRGDDGLLLTGELTWFGEAVSDSRGASPYMNRFNILNRGTGVDHSSRIAVGGWAYTHKRNSLENPETEEYSWGVYALGETQLLFEWDDPEQGLSGFLRLGSANADVNLFSWYAGTGLVYTGLFDGADEDRTGLGIAVLGLRNDLAEIQAFEISRGAQTETALELTHHKIFTDHLSAQLDLQYIIHPGMRTNIQNALVAGIRIIASY